MSEQTGPARVAQQGAEGGVLVKLVLFTVALAVVPLSTYYGTLNYLFDGNGTYAAMSAVLAANLVLAAYIAQSVLDDRRDNSPVFTSPDKTETRKDK